MDGGLLETSFTGIEPGRLHEMKRKLRPEPGGGLHWCQYERCEMQTTMQSLTEIVG